MKFHTEAILLFYMFYTQVETFFAKTDSLQCSASFSVFSWSGAEEGQS